MALPWHVPLETTPSFKATAEEPQPSLLKHYCNVNIHTNPCEELKTGLMCEIGMNNKEPSTIQRLIASGMTVARLNMRDLEPNTCAQIIQSIRQAAYSYSADLEYVYPLALMIDVRGPDIITGDLKGGARTTLELIPEKTLRLTTDPNWRECGTSGCLYVGWEHLTDLKRGDIIYMDSLSTGIIKLIIEQVGNDSIECTVENGGIIGSKMPLRITQIPRENEPARHQGDSAESFVCSDKSAHLFENIYDQIAWAVASDVDALLIPNTQHESDVKQVRDILADKGKHILVFSSIETMYGVDNIDEIIAESDGIYLDRSILSTDLPIEKIFIAQKIIVSKCKEAGKPCICKAILNEQIPTLCVSDIANLVIDGVDVICLELHYDSPLKKLSPSYDTVRMAEHCLAASAIVCRQAERVIWHKHTYGNLELMQSPLEEPSKAICVTAIELAMRSRAVVIICLTNSGRTAKILSHGSPPCPIIAVTRACHTARQLRFWRGVRSMHYFEVARDNWPLEVECRVHAALDFCKAKRLVCAGDAYVVVTGTRRGSGYCDLVRLLYASARDTVSVE
ncbi:unnamed protein product [Plutella xylostella]|uniref:Pyruvate kinase n=1 Tax=Plutella xylostella TaxID=51655 RepID=A0A8S4DHN3_PLUXY|nr:pyruvate kinase [Plutella xylostella]CAG9098682.1 unnamed protein product [Plutella xylostella]